MFFCDTSSIWTWQQNTTAPLVGIDWVVEDMKDTELEANLIVCSSALSACERLGRGIPQWVRLGEGWPSCFGSPAHQVVILLGQVCWTSKCHFFVFFCIEDVRKRGLASKFQKKAWISLELFPHIASHQSLREFFDFFVLAPNNILLATSTIGR